MASLQDDEPNDEQQQQEQSLLMDEVQEEPETSYNVFHKQSAVFTPGSMMSGDGTEGTSMLSQSFETIMTAAANDVIGTPAYSTLSSPMILTRSSLVTPPTKESLNDVHRKWEALAHTWKTTVAATAPKSPERRSTTQQLSNKNNSSNNNTQPQQLLALSPLSNHSSSSPSPLVSPDSSNHHYTDRNRGSSYRGGQSNTARLLFDNSTTSSYTSPRPFRPYGFDYISSPNDTTPPSRGARTSRLVAYTNMCVFERLYGQANIPPSPMMISSSATSQAKQPTTTTKKTQTKNSQTKKEERQSKIPPPTHFSASNNNTNSNNNQKKKRNRRRHRRGQGPANTNTNNQPEQPKQPWKTSSRHPRSFGMPESKPLLMTVTTSKSTPTASKQQQQPQTPTVKSPARKDTNTNPKTPSPLSSASSLASRGNADQSPAVPVGASRSQSPSRSCSRSTSPIRTLQLDQDAKHKKHNNSNNDYSKKKKPWKSPSRAPRSFRNRNNNKTPPRPKTAETSTTTEPAAAEGPLTTIQLRMLRTQMLKELTAEGRPYTPGTASKSLSPMRSRRHQPHSQQDTTTTTSATGNKPTTPTTTAGKQQQQQQQSLLPLNWCTPPRQRLQHPLQSEAAQDDLEIITTKKNHHHDATSDSHKALTSHPLALPSLKSSNDDQQPRNEIFSTNDNATQSLPSLPPKQQQSGPSDPSTSTPVPVASFNSGDSKEVTRDNSTAGQGGSPACSSTNSPIITYQSPQHQKTAITSPTIVYSPVTTAGAKGVVQSAYRDSHHSVEQKHEMVALFRQERQKVVHQQQLHKPPSPRPGAGSNSSNSSSGSLRDKWHATQPMHRRHEAVKRIQRWFHSTVQKRLKEHRTRAAVSIQLQWKYRQKRHTKRVAEQRAAEMLQLCWWRKLSKPELDRIEKATSPTNGLKHDYSHVPRQVHDFVRGAREKRAQEDQAAKLLQLCWWRDLSPQEKERESKLASTAGKGSKFDRIPMQVRDFVVSSRTKSSTASRAAQILQRWWYRRRNRCIQVNVSLQQGNPSSTTIVTDSSAAPQTGQQTQQSREPVAAPAPSPVQLAKQWHKASPQMQEVVRGAHVRKLERKRQNAACIKLQAWYRMVACCRAFRARTTKLLEEKQAQEEPTILALHQERSGDEKTTEALLLDTKSEPKKGNENTTIIDQVQRSGSTVTAVIKKQPVLKHIDLSVGKKKENLETQRRDARRILESCTKSVSPVKVTNGARDKAVQQQIASKKGQAPVIDLNGIYRQAFARRRVQLIEERRARVRASEQIQKWWTTSMGVVRCLRRRRLAVIKIQSAYRGHRFHLVFYHLNCSAIQIQRWWRSILFRRDIMMKRQRSLVSSCTVQIAVAAKTDSGKHSTSTTVISASALEETTVVEFSTESTADYGTGSSMLTKARKFFWSLLVIVVCTGSFLTLTLFLALCWVDGIVSVKNIHHR